MPDNDNWTPWQVKEYVLAMLEERDKRFEQRFLDQQEALKLAREAISRARAEGFMVAGVIATIISLVARFWGK